MKILFLFSLTFAALSSSLGMEVVERSLTEQIVETMDQRPILRSENGELTVDLTVESVTYTSDTVTQTLVGFNGAVGGPTLIVKPGDTLIINFSNNLPPEQCKTDVEALWNTYHAIEVSNLHFHGLHISDEMNPTNLRVLPGESHTYTIPILPQHQGGTHWYHPHFAGSSSLQAGAGAVGLLIVEDLPGDLPDELASLEEVHMAIQFLNMTYMQTDYSLNYLANCQEACEPIELNDTCVEPFFGSGPIAGEYNTTLAPDGLEYETLLVNGVERPTIELQAGKWYRFRTLYVPTRFRTIEPAVPDCEFHLLAKDGIYIPAAPRPVASGYMVSGSRADFLIKCDEPGTYPFRSLSETADSSNWIGSQKRPSLDRIMAELVVTASDEEPAAPLPSFRAARPCYMPDMMDATPDHSSYLLMSGLAPEVDFPEQREACCSNISYYAINNIPPFDITYRGPDDPSDYELDLTRGTIWEIDYYVPQIHPLHTHVHAYQIVELPDIGSHEDYFQVGDYHDVMLLPIVEGEEQNYGKAVLRMHLATYTGAMLAHCHFYRHTDRGMALMAQVTDGDVLSDQATACYDGLEGRGFESTTDIAVDADDSQDESPDESPAGSPTQEPETLGDPESSSPELRLNDVFQRALVLLPLLFIW